MTQKAKNENLPVAMVEGEDDSDEDNKEEEKEAEPTRQAKKPAK